MIVETKLPTKYGNFIVRAYESEFEDFPHLALFTDDYLSKPISDIRIHSECMSGDVFGSRRCDCGEQLDFSLNWITNHQGAVIYLRQEGRGIGLINKLKAYNLQDEGMDTCEANRALGFEEDQRNYKAAVTILNDLDIDHVRLLTNNPLKLEGLEKSGIQIAGRVPIEIKPNEDNQSYLETKKASMRHMLNLS